jgi:predicted pyridoxine 5'-phosphate oxidase superfamily flavin-nucleotide-binding protein
VTPARHPVAATLEKPPLGDAAVRALVERQRLGFVATVGPDGTPGLAPQGTLAVWDDATLVFADIASRDTVHDLLENPACAISVIDPLLRRGYRFEGRARLLLSGPTFDRLLAFYRGKGVHDAIHHMVLVQVERSAAIAAPAIDLGWTDDEIRARWGAHGREPELPPGAVGPGV